MPSDEVIAGLRDSLNARKSTSFVSTLGERVHQLMANMVDGRVLPIDEAQNLRRAIVELVATEALPLFTRKNPSLGIAVLDKLKAYGVLDLESRRSELELARAAKYPPPEPVDWPEVEEIRVAAKNADVATIEEPVSNVYFAHAFKTEEGLKLPDELLALYATCNGFDLSCAAANYLPVFSLLPSESIDVSESSRKFPKRLAVFQGGDEVQLAVFRDRVKSWWLVYEYEYEPDTKIPLDIRNLLQFGIARMNASSEQELENKLSWDKFFRSQD